MYISCLVLFSLDALGAIYLFLDYSMLRDYDILVLITGRLRYFPLLLYVCLY